MFFNFHNISKNYPQISKADFNLSGASHGIRKAGASISAPIRLPDRVTLTLPAADCIGCRWQGSLRTSTSLENRPRTLQRLSVPHGLVFSSGFFVCFVFCRNTFVSVRTNFCEYECVNGRTDLDGLDGWILRCA
jgi:hypothetical protein